MSDTEHYRHYEKLLATVIAGMCANGDHHVPAYDVTKKAIQIVKQIMRERRD